MNQFTDFSYIPSTRSQRRSQIPQYQPSSARGSYPTWYSNQGNSTGEFLHQLDLLEAGTYGGNLDYVSPFTTSHEYDPLYLQPPVYPFPIANPSLGHYSSFTPFGVPIPGISQGYNGVPPNSSNMCTYLNAQKEKTKDIKQDFMPKSNEGTYPQTSQGSGPSGTPVPPNSRDSPPVSSIVINVTSPTIYIIHLTDSSDKPNTSVRKETHVSFQDQAQSTIPTTSLSNKSHPEETTEKGDDSGRRINGNNNWSTGGTIRRSAFRPMKRPINSTLADRSLIPAPDPIVAGDPYEIVPTSERDDRSVKVDPDTIKRSTCVPLDIRGDDGVNPCFSDIYLLCEPENRVKGVNSSVCKINENSQIKLQFSQLKQPMIPKRSRSFAENEQRSETVRGNHQSAVYHHMPYLARSVVDFRLWGQTTMTPRVQKMVPQDICTVIYICGELGDHKSKNALAVSGPLWSCMVLWPALGDVSEAVTLIEAATTCSV
ncbi:hypothetical protein TREMEDRAFT_61556 [Tremella mesenterica DSM 1558]|uniref:uncharacterized protein n=1 Tax=Tremella mesenterica (strain ATCC 24925 / CBS 8224 / DSM 1558 / NBRC 9311 / NRRL Y-6157 / RJB 2259-6 / UBC 559-6) TaxID=578456 RepID=UPI0003F49E03|nr:uncharacterized protein TREMEDRAFT_61556 [Tremella mesenterica DSM 1558]EIW69787.1 hypothetical protein TREMEDRAFT_61556 [Tremella mesenterica DSM 1558]